MTVFPFYGIKLPESLKKEVVFRLLFLYREVVLNKNAVDGESEAVIRSVCEALGLTFVEAAMRKSGKTMDFSVVIHKKDGVSTDDCARLHHALFLKLQTLFQKEIGLEISSPGLDRTLKSEEEFRIFVGSPLRWLEKGAADYRSGIIQNADERIVVVRTETGEEETVCVDNILKAKLNG